MQHAVQIVRRSFYKSSMNDLSGMTAVVTGGGSGVGLAVARALLAEGMNVAIAGRDIAKLDAAAKQLDGGPRLLATACDVGIAEQARDMIAAATARFGGVHLLVNNAGANVPKRALRELSLDDWDSLIRTNLNGAFYCLHAVLPQMLERRSGLVINVVSVAGKKCYAPSGAGYSAAKFGMSALGLCLSNELRDSGVRACNIYPGEIDTPILDQRPVPPTAEQRAILLQPEDLAAAVLFVAKLPPRASVPELIIKPTVHTFG